jgi:hypothetical protein
MDNLQKDKLQEEQQKSFFERMGELLNTPLPGTTRSTTPLETTETSTSIDDDSLLARVKNILNTPLPGSEALDKKLAEATLPEITDADVQENWWETDWKAFKAHQEQDRKGLNGKQRQDQTSFAEYQEQERFQFEMYQAQEFDLFQQQQQAKLNWIQEQQLAQAAGVQVTGMIPPAPPAAPLPPEMPIPPWMNS